MRVGTYKNHEKFNINLSLDATFQHTKPPTRAIQVIINFKNFQTLKKNLKLMDFISEQLMY